MSTTEQPLSPSDEAWEAIPTGMRADELRRRINQACDYIDECKALGVTIDWTFLGGLAATLRGDE